MVEEATKVRLLTGAGLIDAKVVQVDAANDLALLKADGARGLPCEIRRRQWEVLAQALFHRARRAKLGDDGNRMPADGNSFPVFILG